ncbi:hypothetical protein HPP92_006884 [Vanilla planifolia]|uniref:Uncharacterized protein n=1 Tax=Vanilla planifolia TaxID=51239 RepID=A0A835RJB3_VANPL|nr:hypothetical protein HPP92_007118 [Vanilla planifolia]KAG0490021.1 hypothetical protein HPP92_006884 [Vanilla planifolia]
MPARASQCTDEKDTSSPCQIPGRANRKRDCIVQRRALRRMVVQQTSAHPDKRMKPRKQQSTRGCGGPRRATGLQVHTMCTTNSNHQAPSAPMHTCVKPAHGIRIIQLSTKMPSAVVHDL